jgi:hypothetical protein
VISVQVISMTTLRNNAVTLMAGTTPVAKRFIAVAGAVITATHYVEGAP